MQTAAEVFPEATAVLLAGRLRNADETKWAFRSKVLTDNGVDLATLPTVDRIDAALAALTGILALRSNHTTVGDPEEGVILLPSKLPAVPLVRAPSESRSHIGMVTAPSRVVDAGPRGQCQCGCGAAVRRRFLPGHDAKLKSQLFRAKATGDVSATQRLIDLGWLSHSNGATWVDSGSNRRTRQPGPSRERRHPSDQYLAINCLGDRVPPSNVHRWSHTCAGPAGARSIPFGRRIRCANHGTWRVFPIRQPTYSGRSLTPIIHAAA